jgi:hypothetical protein
MKGIIMSKRQGKMRMNDSGVIWNEADGYCISVCPEGLKKNTET